MLLPKQQAQAKAWRLFIVSGSLAWFRRPRLASFTSTTIVETIHPSFSTDMAEQTVYLPRRYWALGVFLSVTDRTSDVAIGVSLGDGLSTIL